MASLETSQQIVFDAVSAYLSILLSLYIIHPHSVLINLQTLKANKYTSISWHFKIVTTQNSHTQTIENSSDCQLTCLFTFFRIFPLAFLFRRERKSIWKIVRHGKPSGYGVGRRLRRLPARPGDSAQRNQINVCIFGKPRSCVCMCVFHNNLKRMGSQIPTVFLCITCMFLWMMFQFWRI